MMESSLSSNLLKTELDLNIESFDILELIDQLCEEQANLAQGIKLPRKSILRLPMFPWTRSFWLLFWPIYCPMLWNLLIRKKGKFIWSWTVRLIRWLSVSLIMGSGFLKKKFGMSSKGSTAHRHPAVFQDLVSDCVWFKKLVHLHKRPIDVESEMGQGTTLPWLFLKTSLLRWML